MIKWRPDEDGNRVTPPAQKTCGRPLARNKTVSRRYYRDDDEQDPNCGIVASLLSASSDLGALKSANEVVPTADCGRLILMAVIHALSLEPQPNTTKKASISFKIAQQTIPPRAGRALETQPEPFSIC